VSAEKSACAPLFAIGVFIGFTLSQAGLVVHWWRTRPARWRSRAALNALGATATGVSTVIFLLAKFTSGAWVVVVAIPLFILLFRRIRAYYRHVGKELALGEVPAAPRPRPTLVIVPVTNVSWLTAQAIAEAESLGQGVIAVTVAFDDAENEEGTGTVDEEEGTVRPLCGRAGSTTYRSGGVEELQRQWRRHPGVPLRVLHTPYSSVVRPLVEYIDRLRERRRDQIVVLIPFGIPDHPWERVLHN
jgi:hypothetical protein